MEWTKDRPVEPNRYLFKGTFDDKKKSGFLIYIREPIEVEALPPESAVYQPFMAIGDPVQVPDASIKQFIRSLDGKYVGAIEYWDGEWAGPIEPLKEQ